MRNATPTQSIGQITDQLHQLRSMLSFASTAMQALTDEDCVASKGILTAGEIEGFGLIMAHVVDGMMECENLLSDMENRHHA